MSAKRFTELILHLRYLGISLNLHAASTLSPAHTRVINISKTSTSKGICNLVINLTSNLNHTYFISNASIAINQTLNQASKSTMPNNDLKQIKITTLDPRFFRLWASQAEATFQVHNLLSIVTGHEFNPRPATESANKEEATAAMNAYPLCRSSVELHRRI
jgi:hypothetical protein